MFWIGVASVLASLGSTANADPKPHLMAALGDSITAASFATYFLVPPPGGPWVGDLYQNRDTYSWASGNKFESHYERLKKLIEANHGPRLDVFNIAEPGADSKKLESQADWVRKKMSDGYYASLDYVTLFTGANDVCSPLSPVGVPFDVLRGQILRAMDRLSLIKQGRIHVLLVGIPMIPLVRRAEIRPLLGLFGNRCEDIQASSLFYCKNLGKWNTEAEFARERSVVIAYNDFLAALAAEITANYPKIDLVFTRALEKEDILPTDVAVDCFHPDVFAQERFSRVLWAEQPWF